MKPFKNVGTALALSPNLEANICESIRIRDQMGEYLYFIHVDQGVEREKEQIQEALENVGCNQDKVKILWKNGDPVDAILSAAEEHSLDLLVAGAKPRESLYRYYRGSIARKLVRKSRSSILLMVNPQRFAHRCHHIVVNGLDHPKTSATIAKTMELAPYVEANRISVIEEVQVAKELHRADDDAKLKQVIDRREKRIAKEEQRMEELLETITIPEGLKVQHRAIIGKQGYTIGHFAQSVRADLLVLNSPDTKLGFIDRVFTHDLEYVLNELPCDMLIIHSTAQA